MIALYRYTSSIVPRSVYTSGKSSSAAGLTATVAKEPETGEFCIEVSFYSIFTIPTEILVFCHFLVRGYGNACNRLTTNKRAHSSYEFKICRGHLFIFLLQSVLSGWMYPYGMLLALIAQTSN